MRIPNGWATHSNGMRKFEVTMEGATTMTIKFTKDYYGAMLMGQRAADLVTMEVEWVRPSTVKPMCNPRELDGCPAEDWEGYCVMAKKAGENTLVVITGDEAFDLPLEDDEELVTDTILSDACSNDAWYPFIVTNTDTYVLANLMEKPAIRILFDEDCVTPADIEANLEIGTGEDWKSPYMVAYGTCAVDMETFYEPCGVEYEVPQDP